MNRMYTLFLPPSPEYRGFVAMIYIQAAVQLIQQWIFLKRRFKNAVLAHSTRLNVSAGLPYMLESGGYKLQCQ